MKRSKNSAVPPSSTVMNDVELRAILQENLDATIRTLNDALSGKSLSKFETVLARLGHNRSLPHWFEELRTNGTLPNLDGKTVGSVIEMLLVAVLETRTFRGLTIPELTVNPAKGVDLPELKLSVKSPSENYCTSEPFFSACERLIGGEFDVLILVTDYQMAKKKPPLKLQILHGRYLRASQMADAGLCQIALKHRDWLISRNVERAKRLIRFLAYVNQGDWLAV